MASSVGRADARPLARLGSAARRFGKRESSARRRRVSPSLAIGALLTLALLVAALTAPWLAPYAPDQVMAGERLAPPSADHPFGVDMLGRDLLSRVWHGARLAVNMVVVSLAIAALGGISLGLPAGYYGGWIDQILSRLMDVWLAFPGLLLAVVVVARLGPTLDNAMIALGLMSAPGFYRLTRTLTLSARRTAYVEAARAVGVSDAAIMLRHILPNISSSLIVLATSRAGMLILAGGSLSFVGLGAQPPQPEWGALLATGRNYLDSAPWLAVYPGLCLTLAVIGLNLLGDGLRDALDPRNGWRQ